MMQICFYLRDYEIYHSLKCHTAVNACSKVLIKEQTIDLNKIYPGHNG